MKNFKRLLCIVLSLVFVLQLLTGCASAKTDDEIYLTKGEFFAYFVYENNLTSDQYSAEEILNCEDGSAEADVIVEWGYLPEDQAKDGLNKTVTKETVVMVCANATFDLKEGNTADIKDADLLKDPQLIANAYASGFFELENGYFDGAEKMSFADCEEIMEKAREYTASFHFEANTEETEVAEGVFVQDSSDYADGDIVIEIPELEAVEDEESSTEVSDVAYSSDEADGPQVTLLSGTDGLQVTPTVTFEQLHPVVTEFTANINKQVFEKNLGNPKVGDTVIMTRFQLMMATYIGNNSYEIIGILKEKKLVGATYVCVFEYPRFEQAVQKKNVAQANGSGVNTSSFTIEKTEYAGWKLEFDVTSSGVKVTAKKDFTVYETGRKQDWQNAQKTITAEVTFEIGDFNLDVKNLKSFASKSGSGYVKITYDTDMSFSLSTSLRYTPDSNRNGKFPSNWSTSRWTDSGSKGAKEIKIARFSPSLYGMVGIDVYIYLQISLDGKVSFRTSLEDGGMQLTAKDGKISLSKLGKKSTEASANLNLHGRIGVDATLKIFSFIEVIKYDVGADLDASGLVNLYYEETLSQKGVYADEEGLSEYAADDGKFSYCIGISIELGVSGKLKDSGVKMILDLISKGTSLDFDKKIWNGSLHFEDGSFVDSCTRGEEDPEALKESEEDEVELGTYKVNLEKGESEFVWLKAIPSETMNLLDSKNSITVKSTNTKVITVSYNKTNKLIIVEAVGEGSAEIIINAKKGCLWWKKSCQQKVSVTVNAAKENKTTIYAIPAGSLVLDPSSL